MAANRLEQTGDPPDAMLNQALMQVLRGARSSESVIGPHSLLEDVYGHSDAVVGIVVGQAPGGGGGLSPRLPQVILGGSPARALPFLEISAVSLGGDRQPGTVGVNESDYLPALIAADENDELFIPGSNPRQLRPLAYDDQWIGQLRARPSPPYPANDDNPVVDSLIDYYTGRVITFLDGPWARRSAIIAYSGRSMGTSPTNAFQFQVGRLGFLMPAGVPVPTTLPTQLVGARFVINGRPFNGAGFGYNPEKTARSAPPLPRSFDHQWLDWVLGDPGLLASNVPLEEQLLALLPNPANPYYTARMRWDVGTAIHADEDYDAPDFQNLLLAGRDWDVVNKRWRIVAPSLHRPDLVNFWANYFFEKNSGGSRPAYGQDWLMIPPAVRRRIILRPDPADHWDDAQSPDGQWNPRDPFVDVNLDGVIAQTEARDINDNQVFGPADPEWEQPFANPDFDAINGPWDVDNDEDSVPDSVWVDLGLPVTTLPDGRQAKPLFAILCLDLDGRLNLNAHGSPAHYSYHKYQQQGAPLPPRMASQASSGPLVSDEMLITGAYGLVLDRRDRRNTRLINVPRLALLAPIPWGGRQPYAGGGTAQAQRQFPHTPAGQGFSAADINLGAILSVGGHHATTWVDNNQRARTTPFRYNLYRWLLEGRSEYEASYGAGFDQFRPMPAAGRYGEPHLVNSLVPQWPLRPRAGMSRGTEPFSGDDNYPPAMAAARLAANTSHPASFAGNVYSEFYHPRMGNYGTPGDLDGDGAVVLDYRGQPLYMNMGFVMLPDPNLNYVGPIDTARIAYPPFVAGPPNNPAPFAAANLLPRFALTPDDPNILDSSNPSSYAVLPESVDEPTEIDLSGRRRMTFGYGADGVPGTPDEVNATVPRLPLAGSGGSQPSMMTTQVDAPLTPAELAGLIRSESRGTGEYQSLRLRQILDTLGDNGAFSDRITTESWDIPCPYFSPTPELRNPLQELGLPQTNLSFVDLLRARVKMKNPTFSYAQVNALVERMIRPDTVFGSSNYAGRLANPDLLAGLRMDLNAPFGNGWDDSTPPNGVIDEPGEAIAGLERAVHGSLRSPTGAGTNNGFGLDLNRDGRVLSGPLGEALARQDYAKQLFILLMLLKDDSYMHLVPSENPAPDQEWLTIRKLAQYCVNCVDFRDRDSICTGFEYDEEPFVDNDGNPANGTWEVDGDLSSATGEPTRGVVWGVEYPDVIITETLAFHDLRVADTSDEVPEPATDPAALYPQDTDFDQVRIPQGSAFVELYATGNPQNPAASRDIYRDFREPGDPATLPTQIAVDLGRTHLDRPPDPGQNSNSNRSPGQPVWRLLVTTAAVGGPSPEPKNDLATRFRNQPETLNFEPDNPGSCLDGNRGTQLIKVDRVVLFGAKGRYTDPVPDQSQPWFKRSPADVYYRPDGDQSTLLMPGEYGVVGPQRDPDAHPLTLDANVTLLGTTKETASGPNKRMTNPRRIVLGRGDTQGLGRPSADPLHWMRVSDIDCDLRSGGDHFVNFPRQLPHGVVPAPNGEYHIRPPVPIPVFGVADTGERVGFNISEPPLSAHYPKPNAVAKTEITISDATTGRSGSIIVNDRYDASGGGGSDKPYDKEFDLAPGSTRNPELNGVARNTPYLTRFKYVLLQRLADPTRPWNANTNPYITVDWSVFDLTIFNGEQIPSGRTYLPTVAGLGNLRFQLGSRERGGKPGGFQAGVGQELGGGPAGEPKVKYSYMDLWSQPNQAEFDATGVQRDWGVVALQPRISNLFPSGSPPTENSLPLSMGHTLGFLNSTFFYSHPNHKLSKYDQFDTSEQFKNWRFWQAFNAGYGGNPNAGDTQEPWQRRYLGSPWRPFPWLTIHNRPFANAMELMLVPASSPSRLLREFSLRQPNPPRSAAVVASTQLANRGNYGFHYADAWWGGNPGNPLLESGPPYGHLLNFFRSTPADPGSATSGAGNYYRLFEFVGVPSRFSGTQDLLTVGITSGTNIKQTDAFEGRPLNPLQYQPTWPYTVPYNRLSRYREPGKLNLNTMADRWAEGMSRSLTPTDEHRVRQEMPTVWQCLTNTFPLDWRHRRMSRYPSSPPPHTDPSFSPWDDLILSRESRDLRGSDRSWGTFAAGSARLYPVSPKDVPPQDPRRIEPLTLWPASVRFDRSQPAWISNPYRSYLGSFQVPAIRRAGSWTDLLTRRLPAFESSNPDATAAGTPDPGAELLGVDATLLRRREQVVPPGQSGSRYLTDDPVFDPLLAVEFGFHDSYRPRAPLGNDPTGARPANPTSEQFDTDLDYRHTDRNPFFRYQLYTKLGGNVTIRSNVYAIWITMGLFEVERVNPFLTDGGGQPLQLRYPDGFKLVREVDYLQGSHRRHKLFAIVDRSIPVGFIRGENVNVDQTILFRQVQD